MKKILSFLTCTLLFSFCFAQESTDPETISYQKTLDYAIENNYDLQKQRAALASAAAQYRQAKGALDVTAGAQASYQLSHQPKDHDDPSYIYGNYYYYKKGAVDYGIYSDDTVSHQTNSTLYLQKLFSIGLKAKLSYSLQRSHSNMNFTATDRFYNGSYSTTYDPDAVDKGHNYGTTGLELELPLFKSFNNSITAMQIDAAKDYLDQMTNSLQDAISKVMISTSQAYWQYFIAYKNYENLKELLVQVNERYNNMDALIKAGVRAKNDLLQMQVNVLETTRSVEKAEISLKAAKLNLLTAIGIEDSEAFGYPEAEFPVAALNMEDLPQAEEVSVELLLNVIANRPDIAALKKNVDIAELKVKMAKADTLPDATLGFGLGVTGTTYSDNFGDFLIAGFKNIKGANVSGSLGITAQLGNNVKKGALDQAEAGYQSALAEYSKARNTLLLQLRNSTSTLNSYRQMVLDANQTLKLQNELYGNEKKRFTAGLTTVNDLLTQDQNNLQAQLSYYQVFSDYMNSILEYKYYTSSLVGVNIENILENK